MTTRTFLPELDAPGNIGEAPCRALHFVGHVNPIAHFLPLVLGTAHMVAAAKGEFVVIDTTGLVHGKGRVLKSFQIESLQPDVLVCLERDEELAAIRHAARHLNILRPRPSRFVVTKSRDVRRRAREAAFRAHFQGAHEVELGLDAFVIQRTALFNGEPVEDARFVYVERLADGLIAVARDASPAVSEGVQVLPRDFADHLLCGVADKKGECLGLGVITGIDFGRRTLSLHTAVPKRRIRVLQLGDLYLDHEGRELHAGRRGNF